MDDSTFDITSMLSSLKQGIVPEGVEICDNTEPGPVWVILGGCIMIETKMFREGPKQYAGDPVTLVDGKEDAFEATLRRAREDTHFRTYFLLSLVSGDKEYISKIFGGLSADDPRIAALIEKQLARKAACDEMCDRMDDDCGVMLGRDDAFIAEMHIEGRKVDAQDFRREYYYGSSMDKKVFVCPGLDLPWSDESSGVTWLGLHGMNAICVVTKAAELDVTRMHRYLKYETVEKALWKFRKTVISEIEDLASPSSRFITVFGQSIPKPFGVVSLALGSDDPHEVSGRMESSDEDEEEKKIWEKRKEYMPEVPGYDEKKTIKYLREQMRRRKDKETRRTKKSKKGKGKTRTNDETPKASGAAATSYLQNTMKMMDLKDFTTDETIKTAISAFQCLFGKEFKPHEIGVCVIDPDYILREGGYDVRDLHAKHLEKNEIQKYLAAIKESAAGSVGSRG